MSKRLSISRQVQLVKKATEFSYFFHKKNVCSHNFRSCFSLLSLSLKNSVTHSQTVRSEMPSSNGKGRSHISQ